MSEQSSLSAKWNNSLTNTYNIDFYLHYFSREKLNSQKYTFGMEAAGVLEVHMNV